MHGFITHLTRLLFLCVLCGMVSVSATPTCPCEAGTFGSTCTACASNSIPQFGLWGTGCTPMQSAGVAECRDGYTGLRDELVNATVCYPVTDRRAYTAVAPPEPTRTDIWPFGVTWPHGAQPAGTCDNPFYTGYTSAKGSSCGVFCLRNDLHCPDHQRRVPCSKPWRAFCGICAEPVPPTAHRVDSAAAAASWVHNFENTQRTSVHWTYNTDTELRTASSYPTVDRLQIMAHKGARNSQMWVAGVNALKPNSNHTLPDNAFVRFYVSRDSSLTPVYREGAVPTTPVSLSFSTDSTTSIELTDTTSWMPVIMPLEASGVTVTGGLVSVDEVSVIRSLVSHPTSGVSCRSGMYKAQTGRCEPCRAGWACPTRVGAHLCPDLSRSIPASNVCICAPGSKSVLSTDPGFMKCVTCDTHEDCMYGYAHGTLTGWRSADPFARSRKQLSCGARSCCAVDENGYVLCWGDNAMQRLGSPMGTKAQTPARDAFPVQGLPVPAVAVAVSQQTAAPTAALDDMSCALLEDGTVRCWGQYRTISANTVHTCTTGDALCGFSHQTKAATILHVSAGTACAAVQEAVAAPGEIWCWGRDLYTNMPRTSAVFAADAEFVDFAVGARFICAIYKDKIVCRTGSGTSAAAVQTVTVSNTAVISASGDNVCANTIGCIPLASIASDACSLWDATRTLKEPTYPAWSPRDDAQLLPESARSTFMYRRSSAGTVVCEPTCNDAIKALLADATVITLGSTHGCAGVSDGRVSCWGDGGSGQLGTCSDSNTPALVSGLVLRSFEQHPEWRTKSGTMTSRGWTLAANTQATHPLMFGPSIVHGRYIGTPQADHWVHVHVYVASCSNPRCTIVLARNLVWGAGVATSEIFHSEKVAAKTTISSVVWAQVGDSISVVSMDGDVLLTSVVAFEDSESCPYRCREREIDNLLPNNQRQRHACREREIDNVLPNNQRQRHACREREIDNVLPNNQRRPLMYCNVLPLPCNVLPNNHAAHATHCATYCTLCRPLIRACSGWILTPPPTVQVQPGDLHAQPGMRRMPQHVQSRDLLDHVWRCWLDPIVRVRALQWHPAGEARHGYDRVHHVMYMGMHGWLLPRPGRPTRAV
jgi:alpha-tubulin suppressor-like RCC1 family protein